MPFANTNSITATDLNNTFRGLHRDFTDRTVTTTAETTMGTVSITGGTMTATGSLYFFAAGTITNANGAKQLTVDFGSATILDTTSQTGTSDWMLRGWIKNTATNAQRIYVEFSDHQSTTNFHMDVTTASQDTTAAVTLRVRGTMANGSDVITETIFFVDVQQIT